MLTSPRTTGKNICNKEKKKKKKFFVSKALRVPVKQEKSKKRRGGRGRMMRYSTLYIVTMTHKMS